MSPLLYQLSYTAARIYCCALVVAGSPILLADTELHRPRHEAIASCNDVRSAWTVPVRIKFHSVKPTRVNIREDLRRVSDQDARYAIVVPRYQVPASPNETRQGSDPGRASPPESRPLVLALRI